MESLADDLVDTGHLAPSDRLDFVEEIHRAALQQRFSVSVDIHAVIATLKLTTTMRNECGAR